MFKTIQLRTVGQDFPGIKSRMVTLLLLDPINSCVREAQSAGDKRVLLQQYTPDMTLLAVRTGRWFSNTYVVPAEIARTWREVLEASL